MLFDFRQLRQSKHQLLCSGYEVLLFGCDITGKSLGLHAGFMNRIFFHLDAEICNGTHRRDGKDEG